MVTGRLTVTMDTPEEFILAPPMLAEVKALETQPKEIREASSRMREGSGTQFDAELLTRFLSSLPEISV